MMSNQGLGVMNQGWINLKITAFHKKWHNNQMSWYGNYNESAKQLDQLIDTRPSLSGLLLYPDFIQQLKAFNPKLLDYISNSPTIPIEMVTYLSVPPSEDDPVDRKYKLPLLTVEMVETETICIISSLLKQSQSGNNYFQCMFDMLSKPDVLPMLAGYFNRVNFTLCRTRYKQALESVYSSPQYFEQLIAHADIETIANCLPLYLCVESSKNIALPEQKVAMKMGVVKSILNRIQSARAVAEQSDLVENLCWVIREIIEKYYLISHGKQMLEIILDQKYVAITIQLIAQQSENSFPAMTLALSYLKYFSLSAYNSEEGNEELSRKNMQRLQSQPFIKLMIGSFKSLLQKVKRSKTLNLYGYDLLEVLCHCITLSSVKVLGIIKQSEFFQSIIDLIFKNQDCNILHKLVERAFLHIFTTEKNIYEKYKEYLFCQISIIQLTAKRLLQLFPDPDCLEKAKQKGYFGILMKIIKIYSSISTTNVQIREAITSKSQIWNKIAKKIIKPYEAGCKDEIGQLQDVPQSTPLEFSVKRTENQLMPRLIQNAEAVEQIKRQEETMPKTLELSDVKKQGQTLSQLKIQDQSFFKSPVEDSLHKKKTSDENQTTTPTPTVKVEEESGDSSKKPATFNDFLNKRKAEVGEEIKLQRTQSGQKRLSADKKTRFTSPSPSKKRNSWKQQGEDQKEQKPNPVPAVPVAKDHLPKIPIAHSQKAVSPPIANVPHNLSRSTVEPRKQAPEDDNKRVLALSMANLESLKKTTIIRTTEQPKQKKYRKARSKDKALFAYLGIGC